MNNVTLVVGIASDIEVKELGADKTLARCLAAIPNWRKKDGSKDFVRLVFWGKTAQTAGEHLTKGSKIAISGRLSSEFYESKTEPGKKPLKTEVVVEEFEFLGPPRSALQDVAQPTAQPTERGRKAA